MFPPLPLTGHPSTSDPLIHPKPREISSPPTMIFPGSLLRSSA